MRKSTDKRVTDLVGKQSMTVVVNKFIREARIPDKLQTTLVQKSCCGRPRRALETNGPAPNSSRWSSSLGRSMRPVVSSRFRKEA